MITLPPQFQVRSPTSQDAEAIVELLNLCENTVEYIDYTVKKLYASWQASEFNVETDAWVVMTHADEIIGYAFVQAHHAPISIACEDPEYSKQGILPFLLQKVEERVYEFMVADKLYVGMTLSTAFNDTQKIALQTVAQRDYELVHTSWRMEIELEHEPEQLALAEDITLRPFIPEQDEHSAYALMQDAFQFNSPFETWHSQFVEEHVDPSLWFLAVANKTVVGGAFCDSEVDSSWIGDLAVLRSWQGKGIGMALLRHTFREFYRHGKRKVGLDVNAENAVAMRLYSRVGMHVAQKYYTYHKHISLRKK